MKLLIRIAATLLLAGQLSAAEGPIAIEPPARGTPIEFEEEVLPILRANCIACHNAKKAEANLNLETPQAILKGGDEGPAVVPGKGAESLLVKVASRQRETFMPPADNVVGAKSLSPAQLGLIQLWIDQGAAGTVSAGRKVRWQPPAKGYEPIFAVAVTPDGQFAAAARGHRLVVYHVPSGTLAATLTDDNLGDVAHRDIIRSLAFDPTGDLLASGAFREVKLWRRPRVTKSAQWPHESALTAAAAADNGNHVATGDEAGGIHVWETGSGKKIQSFKAHAAGISGLAYSPDGAAIYSCSLDKTLRSWKTANGSPLGKPIELPSELNALVLLKNGEWLATGAADGQIRVWETKSLRGEADGETKPLAEFKAHGGSIVALAAHPTQPGEIYSAGQDGLIRRWDAQAGKQLSELRNDGTVVALAIRPDGKRIASAGANYVKLWNSEDGKQLAHISGDPRLVAKVAQADAQVAFTKSAVELARQDIKSYEGVERRVMTTAEEVKKAEMEREKVIKSRDEKKQAAEKAKAENKNIEAAEKALAEAETAVAVAGTVIERAKVVAERAVKDLADALGAVAAKEELLKQEQAAKEVAVAGAKAAQPVFKSLAFSADNRRLAAGCEDGAIHFYDAEAGTHMASHAEHTGGVRVLEFAGETTLLSASADRSTVLWSTPNKWVLESTIGHSTPSETLADRVLALDFSPDGRWLSTGSGVPSHSGEVRIWHVADGRLVREFQQPHMDAVLSVRFSPNGKRLATGSVDRLLKVFAAESGELLQAMAGHTAHVTGVSWQADGRRLVSSGGDNLLKLWDPASGQPVRAMKGSTYQIGPYKGEVTAAQYVGASEQILACSGDGTVRLHRTSSDSDILTFAGSQGYQYCAAATPDGQTVVSGGADGVLRAWAGHGREPRRSFEP